MDKRTDSRPEPIEYEDFRVYLRAMVTYLRETQTGFSYRQFAQRAGYASASFLKHVVDGEKNLSQESIVKFAKALRLDSREKVDFELLVKIGQSTSDAERNTYYARLLKRRSRRHGRASLKDSQYDAYSLWHAFPIREMFQLKGRTHDPAWFAARLFPRIKPEEAQRGLDALVQAKLVNRDEQGHYSLAHDSVETPAEVPSLAVRNYHRRLLENAIEALESLPKEERNVTSLTIAMSPAAYKRVCQRINQFQDELMELIQDASASKKDDEEVFQLGFTVVPVTRREKK